MRFLFRKSIRIGPFLRLNLSRSGTTLTAKAGPLSYNTRRKRVRADLPGPFSAESDRIGEP